MENSRFKFRAYHIEQGKMINIENSLSFSSDGDIWINENKQMPLNVFSGWASKDFKLMQYTGLKDKNGISIYEGDVCRCYGGVQAFGQYEYSGIYEVKYTGNSFDMVKNNCGYGWGLSGVIDIIEIIGNIYENPELLKEKR